MFGVMPGPAQPANTDDSAIEPAAGGPATMVCFIIAAVARSVAAGQHCGDALQWQGLSGLPAAGAVRPGAAGRRVSER